MRMKEFGICLIEEDEVAHLCESSTGGHDGRWLLIIFQLLYAIISTAEIICRGEVFFFEGGPKGQLSPRGGATVNHR